MASTQAHWWELLDSDGNDSQQPQDTTTSFDDLVGRTFLLPQQEDGQRLRACIVGLIEEQKNKLEKDPTRIKFHTSVNDGQFEELLSFAEIIDHINDAENNDPDHLWRFKQIVSHKGPLLPSDPNYNGGTWNVNVEWENGEVTAEPLSVIGADPQLSVPSTQRTMACLTFLDGNDSAVLLNKPRRCCEWSTRPSFNPTTLHLGTSMAMKCQGTTIMQSRLIHAMATLAGRMQSS